MIVSAFGVVHKSFNRLSPKLLRAMKEEGPQRTDTMEQRVRHNYAMFRNVAGNSGKFNRVKPDKETRDLQRHFKGAAHASVTAAGNISRRQGRKLP